MLAKRIIPCLDVKDGKVIKGVQFKNHKVVGDIIDLALRYCDQGADELVFYDISASCENRTVNKNWISRVAKILDIPFCVAGGISSASQAKEILNNGADKISINSPAINNPDLINKLAKEFGSQSVVVGIDSKLYNNNYYVCQYTGIESKLVVSNMEVEDWALEVANRGAGEIVLNCMSKDGMKNGYDIMHLNNIIEKLTIPVVASGGAGSLWHFLDLFKQTKATGALAASVFHNNILTIPDLKNFLSKNKIPIRMSIIHST